MKMKHSVLKVLAVSIACLYIGGHSKVSNAMDYDEFYNQAKEDLLLNVKEVCTSEDFKKMEKKGYKIIEPLGSGHSGLVFLAKDPNGYEYALKFTKNTSWNNDINLFAYNVFELNELPEKYRKFFEWNVDDYYYAGTVGDRLLYDDKLKRNGVVDLGKNACKILGIEKLNDTDKICIILEYIKGTPLSSYKKKYDTECVQKWLKDICKSLEIMYKNNFLHKSIGVGNILIRDNDDSAVLIDYERVMYKELFEKLLEIQRNKFENRQNYFNEDDSKMKLNSPNPKKDYYDLDFLKAFVCDITSNSNYQMSNQTLHENMLSLDKANSLEEFLTKVSEL